MRAVMDGGTISPARRLGGISFILSGTLYLIKSILDLVVGDPPSTGTEILEWRSSHQLALAWTSEVLFAATVLLVPAVIALYRSLGGADRPWVGFGCGVFAAIIPTLFAVLMVHGRLAFPVYGITLDDPATAALVISLYYGGMHAVNLLLAGTAIMLGLAMRRGIFGAAVGAVGVVAGAAQIVVAYPWLVSPILVLILQALLAAWFVLVGLRLAWFPRRPARAAHIKRPPLSTPRSSTQKRSQMLYGPGEVVPTRLLRA
jgi:hypothetical protein